jgi:hypothetical protein
MMTIKDMTMDKLKQIIGHQIDERLVSLLGKFELQEEDIFTDEAPDTRTWEQVKQDIERHRWTPPPGAKSPLELLREDRDR